MKKTSVGNTSVGPQSMADKDPNEGLPWSPQLMSPKKPRVTTKTHRARGFSLPERSPQKALSIVPLVAAADALELEGVAEQKFDNDSLPWSPKRQPEMAIAYIFGDHDNPLEKILIQKLREDYQIDLIPRVSKQPPKPFPLFYLYKAGDDIDRVLEVGNASSDGHCIPIFTGNTKLSENMAQIDNITLHIKSENGDYDPIDIGKLCQEMSECTQNVYSHSRAILGV